MHVTDSGYWASILSVLMATIGVASAAAAQVSSEKAPDFVWRINASSPQPADRDKGVIIVNFRNQNVPPHLWARIFCGNKDLMKTGGYHVLAGEGSSCWGYFTVRIPVKKFDPHSFRILADLSDPLWLSKARNGKIDDGHFVIVFESREIQEGFQLEPQLVKGYFDAGVEIVIGLKPDEETNPIPLIREFDQHAKQARAVQISRLKGEENCITFKKLAEDMTTEITEVIPCADVMNSLFCPLPLVAPLQ
jgi:hypothetical protein